MDSLPHLGLSSSLSGPQFLHHKIKKDICNVHIHNVLITNLIWKPENLVEIMAKNLNRHFTKKGNIHEKVLILFTREMQIKNHMQLKWKWWTISNTGGSRANRTSAHSCGNSNWCTQVGKLLSHIYERNMCLSYGTVWSKVWTHVHSNAICNGLKQTLPKYHQH